MNAVYLDFNATAPIRPQAAEAVSRALAVGANPSSVHAAGRRARALVEEARADVAALIGADVADLVFTAGGTEANALAIESAALLPQVSVLIVDATAHDCVLETARFTGKPVELWPVDADGLLDLAWLEQRLSIGEGRAFVALSFANNETGVIQPVERIAAVTSAHGAWLHLDAAQAAGKLRVDFRALGAETLAVAAHKLGGPQGVGVLAYGPRATLSRRQHGGGQERGRRAGTENVAGIAGFAAAARAAGEELRSTLNPAAWRDTAAARLAAEGATVIGEGAPRLPGTLCVGVSDWPSELQVIALDLAGVMVSAGSACSSGKVKPSRVLQAMGLDDLAAGALRASGGWSTTEADWQRFADVWIDAYRARRKRAAA
jgi:cysteine desulfurase